MSFRPAPPAKRQLYEVLSAGIAREETSAAACRRAAPHDVLDSGGGLFGACVRGPRGAFVYTEPEQLRGVEVVSPMQVSTQVNSLRLAESLSRALQTELLEKPNT